MGFDLDIGIIDKLLNCWQDTQSIYENLYNFLLIFSTSFVVWLRRQRTLYPLYNLPSWNLQPQGDMESDDSLSKVVPAREYYSRSTWWSETVQGYGGSHGNKFSGDGVNTLEIRTPDISMSQDELSSSRKWVNGFYVGDTDGEVNDDELDRYSRRVLSTEIVEIVEDGKSITDIQDRRDEDIYVAVGKDDMDVVKWVLEHAASSRTRIFLIHVSPPITLIPTPVGMLQRSQLAPQQVRRYVNAENFKRKQLLQKYIQMSEDAKVTAETLLLESKDTCKAILDLILVLNITNLVIGTKKPPHSERLKKTLTKGEFVKKNAPKSCCVNLIYDENEVMNSRYINILASSGGQSKRSFFLCRYLSACIRKVLE